MNSYDDLLQAAAALGFAPRASGAERGDGSLGDARALVDAARQAHDLEAQLQMLNAHVQSCVIANGDDLQRRAAGMQACAATLATVCSSKAALADRLRSASTRPSVPVAPQYQPDFSALLQASASSAALLQEGVGALQWAASLDDRPSVWEDQLRCILDAARDMSSCVSAMQQFSDTLSSSTAAVAAAADARQAAGGPLLC